MTDHNVIMGICGADGLCGLCAGEDRTGTDGCGSYFRAAQLVKPLVKWSDPGASSHPDCECPGGPYRHMIDPNGACPLHGMATGSHPSEARP